jgi:phosphoribosylcarboxyaminoimidazole (NCAIR) mutase
MWYNLDSKVNMKNAIIFAAQVFWIFDSNIVNRLNEYRLWANSEVVEKNDKLIADQLKNSF